MSQRDGFVGGFFAGAIFGSVVGGVVGALIATRQDQELMADDDAELTNNQDEARKIAGKRRQMKASETQGMEMETARRSLEDKIAQLNATIDEVRKQLGNVNGSSQAVNERSFTKDS
jgi:predicted RNase H-like nuclease (RuvC/YqgF family)